MGIANPYTFSRIDGVPVKYGSPGAYQVVNFTADLSFYQNKLVPWKRYLQVWSTYCNYSDIEWFGSSGFYPGGSMHGLGRAMDLNFVKWRNGADCNLFAGDYRSTDIARIRRYIAVDALCRQYFHYVLDGWYAQGHENHIHADDTEPIWFNRNATSDVFFFQAGCKYLNRESSLRINGRWDTATIAAWGRLKARAGFVNDPWNSNAAYSSVLDWFTYRGLLNLS